jgi:phospho-N-acetylmuramoyl-pentapeptide-transferase
LIGLIDDYLKLRAKRIAQEQGVPYKKGDKMGWQVGSRYLGRWGWEL